MALRAGGHEVVNGWVALRVRDQDRVSTLRVLATDVEQWLSHLAARGAVVVGT